MQKDTIKYGILYGVISIISVMISYYIDPKSLFDVSFNLKTIAGFTILLGFMYLASKKTRDLKGGFIPFGEALVPAFLVYLIGGFMGAVFLHILMNYYDPSLLEVAEDFSKQGFEFGLRSSGLSEEQILEAMEARELEAEPMPTGLVPAILNFLFASLIMGLPFAAIIAAIVKKKAPELV